MSKSSQYSMVHVVDACAKIDGAQRRDLVYRGPRTVSEKTNSVV